MLVITYLHEVAKFNSVKEIWTARDSSTATYLQSYYNLYVAKSVPIFPELLERGFEGYVFDKFVEYFGASFVLISMDAVGDIEETEDGVVQ